MSYPRSQIDAMFDAVAMHWFGGHVCRPHAKRVGKIVRDLIDLGATPDELRKRINRYKAEWKNIECTPEAIVVHWCRFDGRGGVARRPARSLEHSAPVAAVESATVPQDKLNSIREEIAKVRAAK